MIRFAAPLLLLLAAGCVTNPVDKVIDEQALKEAQRDFVLGNYLAAAGHWEAFLAENPQYQDRAQIHLMTGRAYLGAGRVEQAILTLDQALGETPAPAVRWDIVFHRGVAYLAKGESVRALEAFRSVAGAPPDRGS